MATTDLTEGKPLRLMLRFMIPVFIGNLCQQLYSMVDTLIVGRTISLDALAAVGATGSIFFLIIGFVQGVTSGLAVITAQYFGAHDENGVRRSAAMSLMLSAGITVIVTVASVLSARPLLELMNTPENIIASATEYISVIYYGIFATVFYNLISCIVRSLGDSKTPLIFLVIASILNIGLDLLFILTFQMGIAGAAWATVVSQFVAGVGCLLYSLKKFPVLRLKKSDFRFDFRFAWKHLRVGLPMAFQLSITAIGTMILQSALNSFGSVTIAAYTAASKIDMLATQSMYSLGVAAATYTAQNYGAGKLMRIQKGVRASLMIGAVCSAVGLVFVTGLGYPLISLFTDNVEADLMSKVLDEGFLYLLCNGCCYILLTLIFIYRNALQGMGRSAITVFSGVTELAMRSVAAMVLAGIWGYTGICLSNPIAWLGADIFLLVTYYAVFRKIKKKGGLLNGENTNVGDGLTESV